MLPTLWGLRSSRGGCCRHGREGVPVRNAWRSDARRGRTRRRDVGGEREPGRDRHRGVRLGLQRGKPELAQRRHPVEALARVGRERASPRRADPPPHRRWWQHPNRVARREGVVLDPIGPPRGRDAAAFPGTAIRRPGHVPRLDMVRARPGDHREEDRAAGVHLPRHGLPDRVACRPRRHPRAHVRGRRQEESRRRMDGPVPGGERTRYPSPPRPQRRRPVPVAVRDRDAGPTPAAGH
ncbi:Uncharacterised protein [Streptococcus pyogenes]|nr:Uncharacterised protein [Streptococcus pyogenes]